MRKGHGASGGRIQGPSPHIATVLLLPDRVSSFAIVGLLLLLLQLFLPLPAFASGLLAPAAGSADAATGGATIAEPLSPLGAQFSNPAGLAGFPDRQMGVGLGLAYGVGRVTADVPAGYQATNSVVVPFLETFLVIPHGPWTLGISSMGTSGARFQYGARPDVGVDDGFFSESGVLGVPVGVAYRVSDSLWLGGQIAPLYGSTHLRYSREVSEFPGSPTPFRFSVKGFGVQGMLGVTWKPDAFWALGLSIKPPGRIWADGDAALGAGKQNVNLQLEAPLEAAVGVSRSLATRWNLSYGLRFIDTSVLASSYLRYHDTPSANTPFLPHARDEWRHSIGLSYAWSDSVSVLGGLAKANGIVGSKGVSPMTYDTKDFRLTAGARWKGAEWQLDGAFGYLFGATRHITATDALVMPGKYDEKPAYMLSITISRKF